MRYPILLAVVAASAAAIAALPSEITVKLRMNASEYVAGERIRCVVDGKTIRKQQPGAKGAGRFGNPCPRQRQIRIVGQLNMVK